MSNNKEPKKTKKTQADKAAVSKKTTAIKKQATKKTAESKAKAATQKAAKVASTSSKKVATSKAKSAAKKSSDQKKEKPAKVSIKLRTPGKRPVVAISQEEIALRAYYIAEKRRAAGLPGNEHDDWLEAERQLMEEAKK